MYTCYYELVSLLEKVHTVRTPNVNLFCLLHFYCLCVDSSPWALLHHFLAQRFGMVTAQIYIKLCNKYAIVSSVQLVSSHLPRASASLDASTCLHIGTSGLRSTWRK